jgi:hypothetical protein
MAATTWAAGDQPAAASPASRARFAVVMDRMTIDALLAWRDVAHAAPCTTLVYIE